jgi:hypothetical protein
MEQLKRFPHVVVVKVVTPPFVQKKEHLLGVMTPYFGCHYGRYWLFPDNRVRRHAGEVEVRFKHESDAVTFKLIVSGL